MQLVWVRLACKEGRCRLGLLVHRSNGECRLVLPVRRSNGECRLALLAPHSNQDIRQMLVHLNSKEDQCRRLQDRHSNRITVDLLDQAHPHHLRNQVTVGRPIRVHRRILVHLSNQDTVDHQVLAHPNRLNKAMPRLLLQWHQGGHPALQERHPHQREAHQKRQDELSMAEDLLHRHQEDQGRLLRPHHDKLGAGILPQISTHT